VKVAYVYEGWEFCKYLQSVIPRNVGIVVPTYIISGSRIADPSPTSAVDGGEIQLSFAVRRHAPPIHQTDGFASVRDGMSVAN